MVARGGAVCTATTYPLHGVICKVTGVAWRKTGRPTSIVLRTVFAGQLQQHLTNGLWFAPALMRLAVRICAASVGPGR